MLVFKQLFPFLKHAVPLINTQIESKYLKIAIAICKSELQNLNKINFGNLFITRVKVELNYIYNLTNFHYLKYSIIHNDVFLHKTSKITNILWPVNCYLLLTMLVKKTLLQTAENLQY
jgi:hypothetical protein